MGDDLYRALHANHKCEAERHAQHFALLGLGALITINYLQGNPLGLTFALSSAFCAFFSWRAVVGEAPLSCIVADAAAVLFSLGSLLVVCSSFHG